MTETKQKIIEANQKWFAAAQLIKELADLENETYEDIARKVGILADIVHNTKHNKNQTK